MCSYYECNGPLLANKPLQLEPLGRNAPGRHLCREPLPGKAYKKFSVKVSLSMKMFHFFIKTRQVQILIAFIFAARFVSPGISTKPYLLLRGG